jgi:uncharacterized C2H2 Zn-finger protein
LLNKENYEGHIKPKHEKKFCYKCPKCSYVSLWRKGFREHLLNSHKIEHRNNEDIDNKYKNYERHLIDNVRHKRTSDELHHDRGENEDSKHEKTKPEQKRMVSSEKFPNNHISTGKTSVKDLVSTHNNDNTATLETSSSSSTNGQLDSTCKLNFDKIPNDLDPLSCKKCKEVFTEESMWASHMERLHTIPQIMLLCPECDWGSQHKATFISHLVKNHAEHLPKGDNIDIYQVTMKEKAPLIRTEKGQLRPSVNKNGEYNCPRCDYTYETMNLLESHCKEGHGPHTWYLCPCCPYENRFLQGVREHLSKNHDAVAKTWGSNLEGRKIDKNRFMKNEQRSPPSALVNNQLSKRHVNPNQIFNPRGHIDITKSAVAGGIKGKTNPEEDCIVISDDEASRG